MRIFQRLSVIPLYITYFFKVVDQHSLQAPGIYNFYTLFKADLRSQKPAEEIEAIRNELKHSGILVNGVDMGAGSRVVDFAGNKTVKSIARYGISSRQDCLMLTQLAVMTNRMVCLELGTSLGISTAYLSRAMPEGVIYSFEGNTGLCDIALDLWRRLHCTNIKLIRGDIGKQLLPALKSMGKIDFTLIDANHKRKALLSYFEQIYPFLSSGAMVMIDDIRWSLEMYKAWKELVQDDRIPLTVEFLSFGLLIFREGISKQHYILS